MPNYTENQEYKDQITCAVFIYITNPGELPALEKVQQMELVAKAPVSRSVCKMANVQERM